MATSTITKQHGMTDVIISDGERGYDELIPTGIAYEPTMPLSDDYGKPLLREWLEEWLTSYTHLTEDEDEHTKEVKLQVIDTDTRKVLYVGNHEVATTTI